MKSIILINNQLFYAKFQVIKNVFCLLLGLIFFKPALAQDSTLHELGAEHCIYQYKSVDIDGHEFDFACLEGKKILIVNTASRCMYGKQLYDLQKLYEKYKDQNFIIVAFPSNDFFFREPANNNSIKRRYKRKYGISFPLMAKISVKGKMIAPIFDYLSWKQKNGRFDAPPKWNFQKYLITEQGFIYKSFNPGIRPVDPEIIQWIENKQ